MAFGRKDPSPDDSGNLRGEFREFLDESARHLRTRGELFGIEAKEAFEVYRRKFRVSAFGFACLSAGHLLIVAALVGILGSLFSGSGFSLANWTGAALILGAIHLAAAVVILRKARALAKDLRAFEYTLDEFRKDQAWLNLEKKN